MCVFALRMRAVPKSRPRVAEWFSDAAFTLLCEARSAIIVKMGKGWFAAMTAATAVSARIRAACAPWGNRNCGKPIAQTSFLKAKMAASVPSGDSIAVKRALIACASGTAPVKRVGALPRPRIRQVRRFPDASGRRASLRQLGESLRTFGYFLSAFSAPDRAL